MVAIAIAIAIAIANHWLGACNFWKQVVKALEFLEMKVGSLEFVELQVDQYFRPISPGFAVLDFQLKCQLECVLVAPAKMSRMYDITKSYV